MDGDRIPMPFHAGELRAQELAGIEPFNAPIRNRMPDQHRTFFPLLPFVCVAVADADGWPLATAWLALDAEPESAERQREALLSTFGHGELPAFQTTDALTNHALADALRASGDVLSVTLAALIGEPT